MRQICCSLLVLLLLGGCASRPEVPTPASAQSAGVGLELTVRLHGLVSYRADAVFFERSCEDGQAECTQPLIDSSYGKDGRVYLLNAAPGDYRAVAAMFQTGMPGDSSLYFVYFPRALAEATRVRVNAGELAFAGSHHLSAVLGLCPDSAEPEQLRYAEAIEPGTPKCGLLKMLLHRIASGDYIFIGGTAYPTGSQTYHYRGSSFQSQNGAAEASLFRESARSDLSSAGWRFIE